MTSVLLPPEARQLLEGGAHLVVNVSGGADSDAMLFALWTAYQQHRQQWPGGFWVIHAHLGRNEWQFTLPHIHDYVTSLTGRPPIIVQRQKGDLLDRWWQRYHTLQAQGRTVPPWSSAAARFCTGEMKTQIIHHWIRQQFPHNATVISAIGIRAGESPGRARKSVFAPEPKASAPTKQRNVYRWLPIHHFTLSDVWGTLGWTLEQLAALRTVVRETVQPGDVAGLLALLKQHGYRLHPAYALSNARVSCSACVLASRGDLLNGIAWQPDHFRDLVELELTSGFSFQPGQWLADLRPDLLTPQQHQRLQAVKQKRAAAALAQPDTRDHLPRQLSLF